MPGEVTTEDRAARSMPTGGVAPPVGGGGESRPAGSETGPDPQTPAKGSEVRMIRCAAHGIAYDSEREVCPECAKGLPARP
jgi:hypothetical protein